MHNAFGRRANCFGAILVGQHDIKIFCMETLLGDMKHGRVRVDDTLYPGVRLSINSIVKSIQEEYKHCTMLLEAY